MMSAPWSISALAASLSLPGSYQPLIQTSLILPWGLTRAHALDEGVHAHDHLGDRHRADIADDARLRHLAGDHALDIAAFVEADVVGGDIDRPLVAGAMLELHRRELLGDLDGRIHEAEGGGEDDAVAAGRELADHALGIGSFLHALDIGGLQLVAERLLGGLAPEVVLMAPAEIGDRADIDESGLEGLVGAGEAEAAEGRGGGTGAEQLGEGSSSHCKSPWSGIRISIW